MNKDSVILYVGGICIICLCILFVLIEIKAREMQRQKKYLESKERSLEDAYHSASEELYSRASTNSRGYLLPEQRASLYAMRNMIESTKLSRELLEAHLNS